MAEPTLHDENLKLLLGSRVDRALVLNLHAEGLLDDAQAVRSLNWIAPPADWSAFLDRVLLGTGTLLTTAGVLFFFAWNWNALSRFSKFGILELLMFAPLFFAWNNRFSTLGGKWALFFGSVAVGILLGVIGQSYQTGADSYLLFLGWGLLITPFTLAGEFTLLWILWWVLANLTLVLALDADMLPLLDYWGAKGTWVSLLNVGGVLLLDLFRKFPLPYLQERYLGRAQHGWTLILLTAPVAFSLFDQMDANSLFILNVLLWVAYVGYRSYFYFYIIPDLFSLTLIAFSMLAILFIKAGPWFFSSGGSGLGGLFGGWSVFLFAFFIIVAVSVTGSILMHLKKRLPPPTSMDSIDGT